MMSRLWSALLGLCVAGWFGMGQPAGAEDRPGLNQVTKQTSATSENPTGNQKYRLAYRFQPRQTVWYDVRHEMQITTQFGEAIDVARNQSETRKKYHVAAVDADQCGDLELTIDWVHMTASVRENAAPVEFRSDDSNFQPPQFKEIMEVIGKPQATIKFNPSGVPLKVTANRSVPAETPGSGDASPENYLVPLPETPVAVGEIWKERYDVTTRTADKLPLKVAMLRTYKLTSVERGMANIDFKTSILTPINDPGVSAQLIQRETAGRMVFDLQAGLIVSRDVEVDRTVINPFGQKSSLRAVSRFQERLLPPGEARSKRNIQAEQTRVSGAKD